jgi:hypothetical protein
MAQVKVNLTLDESVWQRFSNLMPKRKKSRIINKLIKKEIDKIERENEEKELVSGFQEASLDKERLETLSEWDILDTEGWE